MKFLLQTRCLICIAKVKDRRSDGGGGGGEKSLIFKTLSIHIHGGKLVVYILKICPSPSHGFYRR